MTMLTSSSLTEKLHKGVCTMGVKLTSTQQQQLMAYLALLNKWNHAYNLTAVRHADEMVSRHLLDSLSLVPFVADYGVEWLDVGSGGGMPGIPLAIQFPHKRFSLLDANGKKCRFMTQVKLELELANLDVLHSRVESFVSRRPFAGICSRAFSSLADFVNWTRHLGDSATHWLAMKGAYPEAELQQLPVDFQLESSHLLKVPGCQGQRHLLILRRSI